MRAGSTYCTLKEKEPVFDQFGEQFRFMKVLCWLGNCSDTKSAGWEFPSLSG